MKNILYRLILISFVGIFFSCEDQNEIHQEFLDKGEITYKAKADSIMYHPGNLRAEIKWILTTDEGISKTIISWNKGEDTKTVDIERTSLSDTFSVIIEGLEERDYKFEIWNEDNFGNSSLKTNVFGKVYGPKYAERFATRRIADITVPSFGVGQINWKPAEEGAEFTRVTYTNVDGQTVDVDALPEDQITELPGFVYGGSISFQTFYKPVPEAIDVFGAPEKEADLPELETRDILSIVPGDAGYATINWAAPFGGNTYTRVSYLNSNGETVEVDVPAEETATEIADFVYGTSISTQSFYKSSPDAATEFTAPVKEADLPKGYMIAHTGLSIYYLPTDFQGGCWGTTVGTIIDGAPGGHPNCYHYLASTCDVENTSGKPIHHITIDLGAEYVLTDIKIDPRTELPSDNVKKFQVWGIADVSNAKTTSPSYADGWEGEMTDKGWIKLLESDTPGYDGNAAGFKTGIPENSAVRYVRFRVLEDYKDNGIVSVSELTFWGRE